MESAAPNRRVAAAATSHALVDVTLAQPSWDLRVVRLVAEADGQSILDRLLADATADRDLDAPILTRLGPAVSTRWLETLQVVRVPVGLRQGRTFVAGCIEVMPVGAGSTEVRFCVYGAGRLDRLRGWRHLTRLAEEAMDRLVAATPGNATRSTARPG